MIQLTVEEFEASKTKEGLEALMTKVCALAVEDTLRLLPSVVQNLVIQVADLKESSDKFYRDYPELGQHKEGVAHIVQELEAKFPGKSLKELMPEVARTAKTRLAQLGSLSAQSGPKPKLEDLDYLAGMLEKE